MLECQKVERTLGKNCEQAFETFLFETHDLGEGSMGPTVCLLGGGGGGIRFG